MHIENNIFKAYDIRGLVPESLNAQLALSLGRAFGTMALAQGENTVAVGRDGRLSGPTLATALIQGLQEAGVEVIDIGMVTTPMLYFAASTLCSSGIQVTGSHNPRDYNGFKMVLAQKAIYGAEIQALRERMQAKHWTLQPGGSCRSVDVLPAYTARILGDIHLARPMKIVVDCGNGVAGASAPDILQAIGCEVQTLYGTVDGNFPNHHPDPSKPENLRDLIAALQAGDAELGLAFDGDGDRLGIVTRDGNTIYPDRQMVLFAQDVLSRVPHGTVVFDVKCSQRLAPAIEAAGGVALMYKTGHSLIKAKMREVDSPLGGEMSGHIFFKERWFGFDDGTYAGCRLLEILSRSANASAVLNALPTSFSTPELNVACAEGQAPTLVANMVAQIQGDQGQPSAPAPSAAAQGIAAAITQGSATLNTIDGLRLDWADGFGLIRSSNTTPVLVLRFEGHTAQALERIQSTLLELLRSVKPDAQFEKPAH
jgi:phosphomannomutase